MKNYIECFIKLKNNSSDYYNDQYLKIRTNSDDEWSLDKTRCILNSWVNL